MRPPASPTVQALMRSFAIMSAFFAGAAAGAAGGLPDWAFAAICNPTSAAKIADANLIMRMCRSPSSGCFGIWCDATSAP